MATRILFANMTIDPSYRNYHALSPRHIRSDDPGGSIRLLSPKHYMASIQASWDEYNGGQPDNQDNQFLLYKKLGEDFTFGVDFISAINYLYILDNHIREVTERCGGVFPDLGMLEALIDLGNKVMEDITNKYGEWATAAIYLDVWG
jgi:hypothetical protein